MQFDLSTGKVKKKKKKKK